MSARVGSYLSDANMKRMCADHQPVPMSKVYQMIRTQNAPPNRLSQRPATAGIMLRAMSKQYGIPFEQLRQQYMNSLGVIKNESVIVTANDPLESDRRIQSVSVGARSQAQIHRVYAPPIPTRYSQATAGMMPPPVPPQMYPPSVTHTGTGASTASGSGDPFAGTALAYPPPPILTRSESQETHHTGFPPVAGGKAPMGMKPPSTPHPSLLQRMAAPLGGWLKGGTAEVQLPKWMAEQGFTSGRGAGSITSLYKPKQILAYKKLWDEINISGINPEQVNEQLTRRAMETQAGADAPQKRINIYRELISLAAREIPQQPTAGGEPLDPADIV